MRSSICIHYLCTIVTFLHRRIEAVDALLDSASVPAGSATIVTTIETLRGGSSDHRDPMMIQRYSRAPKLFASNPDDEMYDKYAACLAATEGLRRIRDRRLAQYTDEVRRDKDTQGNRKTNPSVSRFENRLTADYVRESSKVIASLGMTVAEFNKVGRIVSKAKGDLKRKVVEQAAIYRTATSITLDQVPTIEQKEEQPVPQVVPYSRLRQFSQSMIEIESLREVQAQRLKNFLDVDKLPIGANLCDPEVLPLLSPDVRDILQAFTTAAEGVVERHGLKSQDFNEMLAKTKYNPLFRWKVQKEMRKDM